jgi:hypothetical protein
MKLIGELFGNPLAKAKRAKETQFSHGTTQSNQSSVVVLRYGYVVNHMLGVVFALGLGYFAWRMGISGLPAVIGFSLLALIALRCLIFGETQFQAIPPRVSRQWRFLGFIPVWRRDYPLNRFTGVQRRHREIRAEGEVNSSWTVGLVGPSGRFLPVQLFSSLGFDHPCPEVDTYASRLAEVTRLPLLESLQPRQNS